jgi:hypothetical protein
VAHHPHWPLSCYKHGHPSTVTGRHAGLRKERTHAFVPSLRHLETIARAWRTDDKWPGVVD